MLISNILIDNDRLSNNVTYRYQYKPKLSITFFKNKYESDLRK